MNFIYPARWGGRSRLLSVGGEIVAHERPTNRDDQVDRANLAYRKLGGCELYHDCLTCHVSETKCARYE